MKFVKGMWWISNNRNNDDVFRKREQSKKKNDKKGKTVCKKIRSNLELKKQNLLRKYNFEHVKTCSFCLLKPKCNKDLIRWKKT